MTPLHPRKVAPGWLRRWTRQGLALLTRGGLYFAAIEAAWSLLGNVEAQWLGTILPALLGLTLLYLYLVKFYCMVAVCRAVDCDEPVLATLLASWRDALRYITVLFLSCVMIAVCILAAVSVAHLLAGPPVDTVPLSTADALPNTPPQAVFIVEWSLMPWSLTWLPGIYVASRFGLPGRRTAPVADLARKGVFLNLRLVAASTLALLLVAYGLGSLLAVIWPSLCWLVAPMPEIAIGLYVYLFCREVFDGRSENRVTNRARAQVPVGSAA